MREGKMDIKQAFMDAMLIGTYLHRLYIMSLIEKQVNPLKLKEVSQMVFVVRYRKYNKRLRLFLYEALLDKWDDMKVY